MLAERSKTLFSQYERVLGKQEALEKQLSSVEEEITDLSDEIEVLSLVSTVFRELLDEEVVEGVRSVERLLSEALQAVFKDQDLKVKAEVSVSRGKVIVELKTIQDHGNGLIVEGLSADGFGGAVSTVQSAILRIFVTLKRGMRPLLLMDESLPAFDTSYVHNMGKFLSVLCTRLGLDILLVTHNPALVEAADKSYRIDKKDGAATFTETTNGK